MQTASVSFVCLAVAALGCVDLRYADAVADRPATADVRDASDVPDAPDAPDVPDVPTADSPTAMDVRDAPDVPDVPDVPVVVDTPVPMDARDAPDVPVAIDVPFATDVRDAADVIDAADVRDAPDAPDVPDAPDAGTDVGVDVPRDVPMDIPADFGPIAVTLTNATASYSQTSYEVGRAVDNNPGGGQGWGIAPPDAGAVGEQSAVFEFATTTPFSSTGTRVVVTLVNNSPGFRLASFRLGLTTAPRETFADGLPSGGNLGPASAWTTPLTIAALTATNGITVADVGGSILASSGVSASTYVITLDTPASQLTGLRLDTLLNAAIPSGGPGIGAGTNPGNFILTELLVSVSRRP